MPKALLSVALFLSGCSLDGQTKTEHLIEHYYTGLSADGEPGLYFDDPKLGMTYLNYAVQAGVSKSYVVACADSCYIFPVAAAAVEAARRAQLVYPTEVACRQKIYQLTGDSIKFESLL